MSLRSAWTAAACACAYAALAVTVAAGGATSVDRWAIEHAMPLAQLGTGTPSLLDAIVPLLGSRWDSAGAVFTNVVTLPAAFAVATVLVALACARLRGRTAVTLAAVFVAGNAIEELTKETLTRPALYHHGFHVAGFDSSYPSGHTIRTVLVATAIAAAWPRARYWIATWAVCSVATIELGGLHVPTDVAGGLLLAGALLATTSAWRRSGPSRSPSAASRPSARAR